MNPLPTLTEASATDFVLTYHYGEGRDTWPALEATTVLSVTAGQGPEAVISVLVFDGSHAHNVLLTPKLAGRFAAWLQARAMEGFEYERAVEEMKA